MHMQTCCHLHVSAAALHQQLSMQHQVQLTWCVHGGCSAAETSGCHHASLLLLCLTALYSNVPAWMVGRQQLLQLCNPCCAPSNSTACMAVFSKCLKHLSTLSRMTSTPSCPTATPFTQPNCMSTSFVCLQTLLLIVHASGGHWRAHNSSQLQLQHQQCISHGRQSLRRRLQQLPVAAGQLDSCLCLLAQAAAWRSRISSACLQR